MQYKKKDINDRILEAGKAEYSEKGYRAGNIATIAANAGVPVGNLYRYFDGKAGLLDAIVKPAYAAIPKLAKELSDVDVSGSVPLKEIMSTLASRLLLTFDEYGQEILILADKCAATRYEDFTELVVNQVAELIQSKLYLNPTDTDALMARLTAKSFVSSVFDILRCSLSREKTEEMLRRILNYHFSDIDDRK